MERAARRALALLACTQFLLILDTAIINVAAPSIGGELDISASSLSWVANAYLVTFGGLLLLSGRAADLFGRRGLFIGGLGGLVAGSVAAPWPERLRTRRPAAAVPHDDRGGVQHRQADRPVRAAASDGGRVRSNRRRPRLAVVAVRGRLFRGGRAVPQPGPQGGVAAARTLVDGGPENLTALTNGFATAFLVSTGVALTSALLAAALLPVTAQWTSVPARSAPAPVDDGPTRTIPQSPGTTAH